MKFQINPNTTLREIRQEFHNHFPYLKLEFFEAGHEAGHGTPKSALISDYNQSAGVAETVAWEVNAEMTVKQLQLQRLYSLCFLFYGVFILCFKRSENKNP